MRNRVLIATGLLLVTASCERSPLPSEVLEPALSHNPDGCASCATISSTGAIQTELPHTIGVQTDTKNTLKLTGGPAPTTPRRSAKAFTLTQDSIHTCTVIQNPLNHNLGQYLVQTADDAPGGITTMVYDKRAEPTNHVVFVGWLDSFGIRVNLWLSGISGYPPLTVTADQTPPLSVGTTRYTFTGGAVRVQYLSGRGKSPTLTCSNLDTVVIDVER